MKKKILIRIGSLQGGGAEKVLVTLLNLISPTKYEIHLLLNSKRGVYLNQIPDFVVVKHIVLGDDQLSHLNKIQYLFYKLFRRLKAEYFKAFPQKLYGTIVDDNYDIEIAFLQDITPEVVKSGVKSSRKIAWVHNNLLESTEFSESLRLKIKNAMYKMDHIVCVSNGAKLATLEYLKNKSKDVTVIYNPVNIESILKSKNKNKLFREDLINLVAVGRLSEEKGFSRILYAAKELIKKNILNFQFHIIGEGHLYNDLKNQIEQNNLGSYIKLLGYISEPYSYIKQADIFVLSSKHEGFSLVVAEAMVLQTPIIATKTLGPQELLKDGELGYLVENNKEALAQGIEKIILDKSFRNQLKDKLKHSNRSFDSRLVIEKVEHLLDTI